MCTNKLLLSQLHFYRINVTATLTARYLKNTLGETKQKFCQTSWFSGKLHTNFLDRIGERQECRFRMKLLL